MTLNPKGSGKLPGKTEYAGRRRSMTRVSGFKAHSETSGGEVRTVKAITITLKRGETVALTFRLPKHSANDLLGYGVWFWHTPNVSVTLEGGPASRTLTAYPDDTWNKAGSIWTAHDERPITIRLTFTAQSSGSVALHDPICGRVHHKHLDAARPELLTNMYQFAPEAIFVTEKDSGKILLSQPSKPSNVKPITLKSCNRCGRYLPINLPSERHQLSFSNHCVAEHRRPCRHSGFGRLRNIETGEVLQLNRKLPRQAHTT